MQSQYQQVGFETFDNQDSLNLGLAQRIAELLKQGIAQNGQASLVVSGGKTPMGLFQILSTQPLEWRQVTITLADERWVESDTNMSNERMVKTCLLQNLAAEAKFVGLKNPAATPFEGEALSEQRLATVPHPFDVVILGMGEDGHTASLFPQAVNLGAALEMTSGRTCMGIDPVTAPAERMTLTLPALLNSRHIFLHLVGENKRETYQTAIQGDKVTEMPIRAVLKQQQVPVTVMWCAS